MALLLDAGGSWVLSCVPLFGHDLELPAGDAAASISRRLTVALQNSTRGENEGRKIAHFCRENYDGPTLAKNVLVHYGGERSLGPTALVELQSGFSGAQVWRLACPLGSMCLRAWPLGMRDGARLAWMHRTLASIHRQGFTLVPVPWQTSRSHSWVAWDDRFWELAPWMPGQADDPCSYDPRKLPSALTTLAAFHAVAARVDPTGPFRGISPALQNRAALMTEIRTGLDHQLRQAVTACPLPRLDSLADQILALYPSLAPRVFQRLNRVLRIKVPLQICHGDLWRDHVLFREARVSGLIDFGNMRVESRVSDVARLLGSLVGDDPDGWKSGLEAYQQDQKLLSDELRLLGVFDQTSLLLSGMNWLRWIYIERREFRSWSRVADRLEEIVARLSHLQQVI